MGARGTSPRIVWISSATMMLAAAELLLGFAMVRPPSSAEMASGLLLVLGVGVLGALSMWARLPIALAVLAFAFWYWPNARLIAAAGMLVVSLTLIAPTPLARAPREGWPLSLIATCAGWLLGPAVISAMMAALELSRAWPVALLAFSTPAILGSVSFVGARRWRSVDPASSLSELTVAPLWWGVACWVFGVAALVAVNIAFGSAGTDLSAVF